MAFSYVQHLAYSLKYRLKGNEYNWKEMEPGHYTMLCDCISMGEMKTKIMWIDNHWDNDCEDDKHCDNDDNWDNDDEEDDGDNLWDRREPLW